MSLPAYVLLPIIMVVAIGAVVGVRGLYRSAFKNREPILAADLANMTLNVEERTRHVDERTRNL